MKTLLILLLWVGFLYAQVEIKVDNGIEDNLNSLAFSPDSKYLLYCNIWGIKLLDVLTGKPIKHFKEHEKEVVSIAWLPDSHRFLAIDKDEQIILWDIGRGAVKRSKAQKSIKEIIVDPGGKYFLVVHSFGAKIDLWDIKSFKFIQSFEAKGDFFHKALLFHERGLVVGAGNKKYYFYNLITGEEISSIDTRLNSINALEYDPITNRIYASSGSSKDDSYFEIIDASEKKIIQNNLSKLNYHFVDVTYNIENSEFYCAATDGFLRKIDLESASIIDSVEFSSDRIMHIALSQNGKYLAASNNNKELAVWNANNFRKVYKKTSTGGFSTIRFVSKTNQLLLDKQNCLMLWDLKKTRLIWRKEAHGIRINDIDISKDGTLAATAGADKIVKIWDITTSELKNYFRGHKRGVSAVKFSDDNNLLISGSADKSIKIWDLNASSKFRQCKYSFDSLYATVAEVGFSKNSNRAYSGSWASYIRNWDLKSENPEMNVRKFKFENPDPSKFSLLPRVVFTEDCSFAFTAGGQTGNTIKKWALVSETLINQYSFGKRDVSVLALGSNDSYLLAANYDGDVIVLDLESNEKIIKIKTGGFPADLTISTDIKRLFVSHYDGSIQCWDIEKSELVYTVYFNTDGEQIIWLPEGYFSGSEKLARDVVYIRDGFSVKLIDQVFEKYYRPDIVQAKINGEDISKYSDETILAGLKQPPTVKIVSPVHNYESGDRTVKIKTEIIDNGGGIDDVRLYHNGSLISGTDKGIGARLRKNIVTKSFDIGLVDGENVIRIIAFNEQRTASLPAEVTVYYKEKKKQQPNLYILAIGIEKYKNRNYQLNYAVDDAEEFTKVLGSAAKTLFNKIIVKKIYDEKADKSNIISALEQIKKESKAEDVFVFYYSGHGIMSLPEKNVPSRFYFIPVDVMKMVANGEQLENIAVSGNSLLNYSRDIQARKQLFIFDACQSEGVFQEFNLKGPAHESAIAQLARASGRYFLSSSLASQSSLEEPKLGHGLYTYSILEAIKGNCDFIKGKITVSSLKRCVEEIMPKYSEQYKSFQQMPTGYGYGQDFPIGVIN
ncbi:MAG: hypothetical protein SCALA702_28140 [Melioribacteraceae bacterium]|nr:MAG: hypothetical protein SCALA702_28140 [Melioribacteraceae bacterium]